MTVVRMLVGHQLLLTGFLAALLWFLHVRLRKQDCFRWWAWACTSFAGYLSLGALSLRLAPASTFLNGSLVFASLVCGFLEIPLLLFGAYALRAEGKPRPQWVRAGIALAVLASALIFAEALHFGSRPFLGFQPLLSPLSAFLKIVSEFGICLGVVLLLVEERRRGELAFPYGTERAGAVAEAAETDFAMPAGVVERDRLEEALRQSEERFRMVANSSPVLVWMAGLDSRCYYFNPTWLEFTGRTMEAELQNGWREDIHPEDLNTCLETYAKAFDRREPFRRQYRLRQHDGAWRWMLDIGVPRFNTDGSVAGYIGYSIDFTEHKLGEDALSGLSRRLMEAHEEERAWIARELHDDVSQRIVLLTIRLGEIERDLPPSAVDVRLRLQEAQQHISELGSEVQRLSHGLHSSKLEYLGIAEAARSFCKEISEQQKVAIEFNYGRIPQNLPQENALCLFRVLQEALQNAVKHSGVKHFTVELSGTPDEVQLAVSDSGCGFERRLAIYGQGLGLVSMQERLRLVEGHLAIESKPGRGTTVRARVPLRSGE